ncbi:hypothetical protein [Albidovulum sp.]|uniref:hypothetical protein n=1 Tax=Albidovulum sp. TaxID=1872424 RepID=UPI0039B9A1CE
MRLETALEIWRHSEPVSDYANALGWLARYSRVEDWLSGGPLPLEAQLVVQIWWINDDQLRRDMAKLWRGE